MLGLCMACHVGVSGVFDCVGPFPFGRAVAGWVFVLVELVLVWCPVFVVAVTVVAEVPACAVSLVPAVARGFQCAWLRHQCFGLVCVWTL